MSKVLIVDDEINIVNVIKEYCEFNGYETDTASDGLEAYEKVKINDYDCIIMDIMMPKLSGYEAVEEIKKIKDVPIILCSAKGEEYDKLKGFELGIDDYISKPFSPKEVMARIGALIKRSQKNTPNKKIIFNNLLIDKSAHTVSVCGDIINITNKEYDMLLYLIENRNKFVTRQQLLENIWCKDSLKDMRTIDTHIKMLRAHLKSCGDMIKTVRGEGYKFEA